MLLKSLQTKKYQLICLKNTIKCIFIAIFTTTKTINFKEKKLKYHNLIPRFL